MIQAMGLSDPNKSDIRIGMELGQTSKASRYYKLTINQTAILEKKLKENVSWHYTNTSHHGQVKQPLLLQKNVLMQMILWVLRLQGS